MWLSDRWKDYELIDCSRGEKLERWGDQLLVRPDPQAIWDTPRRHPGWKRNAGRYARSSSGVNRPSSFRSIIFQSIRAIRVLLNLTSCYMQFRTS